MCSSDCTDVVQQLGNLFVLFGLNIELFFFYYDSDIRSSLAPFLLIKHSYMPTTVYTLNVNITKAPFPSKSEEFCFIVDCLIFSRTAIIQRCLV